MLTETSKPIFSICQSQTLGTQVRSMCRGEGGEVTSTGTATLWALVGCWGRMETSADLGSRFFHICLGLKFEGLNHIGSYEENKQRLEPHSPVGFS